MSINSLKNLQKNITCCTACPRLVSWREQIAKVRAPRFIGETYWGKPVPSFGDARAQLLVVGLAPAAHGANRTGRMFTGDRSGEWLYRALHKSGYANQAASVAKDDGLELTDCYITAAARCAPPQNKLLPEEMRNCRPFLLDELRLLHNVRVVVGLGKIAFDATYNSFRELGWTSLAKRPAFSHGAVVALNKRITLLGSYHPSQQNTFTGKLTEKMFDAVFRKSRLLLAGKQ